MDQELISEADRDRYLGTLEANDKYQTSLTDTAHITFHPDTLRALTGSSKNPAALADPFERDVEAIHEKYKSLMAITQEIGGHPDMAELEKLLDYIDGYFLSKAKYLDVYSRVG